MSICRAFLRVGGRSLSRPTISRTTPNALQSSLSRQYFNASTTNTEPTPSTSTTIEQHVEKLTTATDIRNIHSHYINLVTKLKESEKLNSFPTRRILSKNQIHKILWLLAKSGRPSDIQRIYDILLDMPLVFGVNPTLETHTSIIRGLIHRGDTNSTRKWIEGLPKRAGSFTPTLEQYHLFLEALPDMEGVSLKLMRSVVNKMRTCGCKPTIETFRILFIARMKLGDKTGSLLYPVSMALVFEDMEKEGIPYDASFGDLLLEEYTKRGEAKIGGQMFGMYEDKFHTQDYPGRQGLAMLDLKLVQMAQARGMHSAIQFFRHWKPKQKPSPQNITSMLRHSRQLHDLQLLEREFGVKCNVIHWSFLINNNVRIGKAGDAYSIYKAAKHAGITPDAAMVAPLIHHLCQANLNADPSEEQQYMGFALHLYDDLRKAFPPETHTTLQLPADERSGGPDCAIYTTLLHGLATCRKPHEFMGVAIELMDDMAQRNLFSDDNNMVTSIIIFFMRNASSIDEALSVYRKHKAGLDEKGYGAVLSAFCKLNLGDSIQIPSLKGYFEIVKDMRKDGEGATTTREKLILTTRRAHDLLTLEASLSPDTVLWNQMMNTYQRLGCFGDAYRVWEMMYLSGQFDSTSVSTILDACGYAGAYSVAKRITTRLANDSYQFTAHNWNTWLECLCRMGRLTEAVTLLCGQDVKPDVESVKIVFKFAKSEKKGADVLVHVRSTLPHIWEQLPSSIRSLI
ncbi:hypothetical protein AN958_06645 [Leucoagaricus sp. SymC.cos]|nr:hypothetical protein AN958_06645 [Leucoagaricus sp. SymC.cos]